MGGEEITPRGELKTDPGDIVPDVVREPDARVPLPGEPDACELDARMPDAREPDAREPDARVPDARVPDARVPDAIPERGSVRVLADDIVPDERCEDEDRLEDEDRRDEDERLEEDDFGVSGLN